METRLCQREGFPYCQGEQAKMVLMQMRGRGASLVAIKHKDDLNGPQVDY